MKPAALALLALLPLPARAAFTSGALGTSAGDFLQLGAGARGDAMGGAFAAAADGPDALYWNPAGLSRIQGGAVTAMHAPYVASSYYDYLSAAQRAGPGALAAGVQYFSAGPVGTTDASGADNGSLTPNDLAASLGYGFLLPDGQPLAGFSAGLAGKYVQSTLADTARTEAADFGLLSPSWLNDRLRVAFTARNVGGAVSYGSAKESLPLTLSAGTAVQLAKGWLLTAQGDFPRDSQAVASAGTEYKFDASPGIGFAGRFGYTTRTTSGVPGFTGLTLGVGFSFRTCDIDYAAVPMGDLGLTHRISFTLRWKAPERRAPPQAAAKAPPAPPPPAPAPPADPLAQHMLAARAARASGNDPQALQEWRAVMDLLPADDLRRIEVGVEQGAAAARLGERAEAVAHFLGAIAFGKAHGAQSRAFVEAYIGLADQLQAKGNADGARRNYKKALTLTEEAALKGVIQARLDALDASAKPAGQ